ncbi:unnamed protein product, partial [Didymodactylos carnosus]
EKDRKIDDFVLKLELANKTNETTLLERTDIINNLAQQLTSCQERYNDLMNENNKQIHLREQLQQLNSEKNKAEQLCNTLQIEIQQLKEKLQANEDLFKIKNFTHVVDYSNTAR